ncbi:hypothetical protein [Salinarimonas chemoclinalis]|uniref:hypothetical protein n=1 Tax=Salinarimonas chemoclinalis TaxID=3241599 RepID=UPI003556B23D
MALLRRLAAVALLVLVLPGTGTAEETLHLTGLLHDGAGQPLAGRSLRVVLGSDPTPRAPAAGRVLVTGADGRFALTAPVTRSPRRVRLDSLFRRHDALLLEIGFELDILGRPALHWVELDFIAGTGPRRGIAVFLPGGAGLFDQPLPFRDSDQTWSLPDDPQGLRLTSPGVDVLVESWDDGQPGRIELDLGVGHLAFERR